MSVRNAVATRESAQPTVGQFIQQLRPEIARAAKGTMLDPDRMARLALTVVRKDQALARCAPESFAGALLTAAALGLEPGINGEAYLVAYRNECTLIVGYQGLAKLFWQHPMAKHLDAQAVHEHDEFEYAYGLDPFLTHKPAAGDRGKVIAYYAVAALTSGAKAFIVLTPDEVKALRGGKVGSNGGIADPMHWMERKTALRQLFKLVPKSATLARALDADEKSGSELRRELDAAPAEPPALDQPAGEGPPPEVDEHGVVVAEIVDDETGGADPQNDNAWPEARKPADA